MYKCHTFEERLNIISRLIAGEPLRRICREERLDRHMVRQWYLRYKEYGKQGLRDARSHHYTACEKSRIVEEYAVKRLPLQELCLRYDLNRSTIQSWTRKARNGQPLESKRTGRPRKEPMARPKKKEPQTELEKLQAENLRLRAENALLKKVRALVEEQNARARLNGQKPSTN